MTKIVTVCKSFFLHGCAVHRRPTTNLRGCRRIKVVVVAFKGIRVNVYANIAGEIHHSLELSFFA